LLDPVSEGEAAGVVIRMVLDVLQQGQQWGW
jgi:hypothetical protein